MIDQLRQIHELAQRRLQRACDRVQSAELEFDEAMQALARIEEELATFNANSQEPTLL